MKKDELKRFLLDLGISPKLLEMPAIMERLYPLLKDKTAEEIKSEVLLKDSGKLVKLSTDDMVFKDLGEEVQLQMIDHAHSNDKQVYIINKYGMDEHAYCGVGDELIGLSTSLHRTTDGQLELIGMQGHTSKVPDNGSAILDYYEYTTLGTRSPLEWEDNKRYLTENYPITREWFELQEKSKQVPPIKDKLEEDSER